MGGWRELSLLDHHWCCCEGELGGNPLAAMESCLLTCAAILAVDWNSKGRRVWPVVAVLWGSLCFWGIWGFKFQIHAPLCWGWMCMVLYSTGPCYLQALCPCCLCYPQLVVFENSQLVLNYFFVFVSFGFWWCGLVFFNSVPSLFWIMGRFQHWILNIVFILMNAIMISNSQPRVNVLILSFGGIVLIFLCIFCLFWWVCFVFVLGSGFNHNYYS